MYAAPLSRLRIVGPLGVLALAALWVTGCASGPGKMEPPSVSLAEVQFEDATAMRMRFRVRNIGDRELPAREIELRMTDQGEELLSVVETLDINIPPQGVETVVVRIGSRGATLRRRLDDLSAGRRPEVSYKLTGALIVGDERRRFDFTNRARLTPTPGRPGSFR